MDWSAQRGSKRAACRRRIADLIEKNRLWGRRLPPERAMAADLGVARRTLQEALADLQAEGIVERRQGVGTFARARDAKGPGGAEKSIAVITGSHVEDAPGWHYRGEMILGAVAYGAKVKVGCEVLARGIEEERARIFDASYMRRFSGFVSVSDESTELMTHLLGLRRGPVVLLDDIVRDLPVVGIVDGSFEGAQKITRHLLGRGHRRVAFIDTHRREILNPRKYEGYRSVMVERGLYDEELVVTPESLEMASPAMDWPHSEGEPEAAYAPFVDAAVERLLGLGAPPSAIFCFDDYRAVPAVAALERRGLKVGADIAVAGFGDTAVRRGVHAGLTSCRIYPRKMGRAAVEAASGDAGGSEGRVIIVPNRVYVRESTKTAAPTGGPRVGAAGGSS
ncbi:MAG: GntR family transcriptional regulator [Planctomycetota bacterium]